MCDRSLLFVASPIFGLSPSDMGHVNETTSILWLILFWIRGIPQRLSSGRTRVETQTRVIFKPPLSTGAFEDVRTPIFQGAYGILCGIDADFLEYTCLISLCNQSHVYEFAAVKSVPLLLMKSSRCRSSQSNLPFFFGLSKWCQREVSASGNGPLCLIGESGSAGNDSLTLTPRAIGSEKKKKNTGCERGSGKVTG